jgi:hypothetical protein
MGQTLVPLLILIALLAFAAAGYVYITPTVTTVAEETNQQRISADVETSTRVTGNTSLYEPGQRLSNMPVYFFRASPNLTLHVETAASPTGNLTTTQRLVLVTEATRNQQTFYSANRTLVDQTTETTDGRVVSNQTINVSEIRKELQIKRSETSGIGTFQTVLRLNVTYQTTDYQGTVTARAPLEITSNAYWVGEALRGNRSHSTTVQRTVTEPPDPVTYGGLSVAGFLGFVSAAGVIYLRRTTDVEVIQTRLQHSRHNEWISHGEFPTAAREKDYISIDSLDDLVDIAIDSNKRVIYDRSIDSYAVIDGSEIYFYSTDEFSTAPWLDM